ncbi:MAG: thymidylate synthase, partial [Chloroflexi bacterium]|nr:thymidylate synthase [Chloroflexota bacterium]
FISGSTDNKVLNKNKVTIWNGNSSKEYMERIGLSHYKDGDLGPIYGFQWRHFGAKYIDCDNDYKGEGIDQLSYIINEIKNNPTSRRIILSSWNPMDINKMALPPCHVMVQFYVDTKNKYLDAKLIQRSGDMFLGIPFNIASYSILMHIIGNLTGYNPRYFIHDIGDAHIYDKHRSAIDIQLKRKTFNFPQLIIKRNFKDIDDINEEDFEIKDYKYYPFIKAEMIA